jgi:hypothetical protein
LHGQVAKGRRAEVVEVDQVFEDGQSMGVFSDQMREGLSLSWAKATESHCDSSPMGKLFQLQSGGMMLTGRTSPIQYNLRSLFQHP